MKIYIEYVVIDNLIINFLLLLITSKCLHLKANKLRLILSAMLGTAVAVLLPLINMQMWLLILTKCALGIMMVLIAYKIKNFKTFAISLIVFVSLTFLMGGACVSLILLVGGNINTNYSSMGYDAKIPLGLMLLIISAYIWLISIIARHFYRRRDCVNFMAKVTLELNGHTAVFNGFIDSGNRLFDNKTGLPVIIVSKSALKNVLTKEVLQKIEENQTNPNKELKTAHFIQYSTLSGKTKPMLVFAPHKLEYEFKGKKFISNVMVGVADYNFCDSISYDALLHPCMLA
ncbi:MAG: sigma-E processing peptidase SpoIIGA [Clostridia bacterium]|nr:sigma-E processing peptidase SpoIIGA [Clostridia bacterium]